MPELLKPRPVHVHSNFVFSVCKLLKAKEGPRSRTDDTKLIFLPKTCMVNGTWVRDHVARSH